jgi:transmembrane sensor
LQHYTTLLGEVRNIPLADGSVTAINTETEVGVALTPQLRRLVVAKGEAWFQVAKDPSRPFVVEAGDARVEALGTAFSVRRRDDGAEVLVTDGAVEVWTVGAEDRRIRLDAGSKAFLTQGQPPQAVKAETQIANALAWRSGQIALYGETLADAAAEFNRYNARKIVIADPELASEKVVGQFGAYDPEGFARAAAGMLGAHVVVEGPSLRLYRVTKP